MRSPLGIAIALSAGILTFSACSDLSQESVVQPQAIEQSRTFELPQQPQGDPIVLTVPKAEATFEDEEGGENARRRGQASARARFNIQLEFLTPVTAQQEAVFQEAAARWERIIIKDVENIAGPIPSALGPFFIVPPGEQVDDIIIEVVLQNIDGPGNILGAAGPNFIRFSDNLPLSGFMFFDTSDLAVLEAFNLFDEVIIHEMGHVLGIGTVWDLTFDGVNFERQLIAGTPENPFFTGRFGNIHWRAAGGENALPIEGAAAGPGTAFSHWSEDILDNELMTGFLNLGVNPLSRITAGSLRDLGYGVALVGDPYSVRDQIVARLNTEAGEGIHIAEREILYKPKGYIKVE
ncbi:leishmanolysin-related zinc metalloendopeptidase [uncultured Algoriphagus sp.]|uniref:leishmanolysin-related zinc metalloendopeptidase n=1 Tax=uncultured Algoriphagus sp. TaxID=417365 RepID=UPI0025970413|nr:leishmanolysin-related zinc metalloendopeptidase [uncultured Algoriphagus sp.]